LLQESLRFSSWLVEDLAKRAYDIALGADSGVPVRNIFLRHIFLGNPFLCDPFVRKPALNAIVAAGIIVV